MCYTAYRFVDCYRSLEQENEHTIVLHRHPKQSWNDQKCLCSKLHEVLDRHLPCPNCLKQILLRNMLQQKVQDEAAPGESVELDYTKHPVFYGSDESSPSPDPNRKPPIPISKRQRRNTCYPGVGEVEPYRDIGHINQDNFPSISGETLVYTGSVA
ncbi:hypothetical protein H072_3769 [Dactylellina haptotyla CBS 200.50]|uniref:Uncharacterized protein n=1 Tax=Dactylellina haptotyla (strain CBS 200.50) TaxID=1284197 RepID=S8AHA1_DACHA|nr:hypothetical protein H072_3769 [Dactylellina haptotyla CBS 200.50]